MCFIIKKKKILEQKELLVWEINSPKTVCFIISMVSLVYILPPFQFKRTYLTRHGV